MNPAISQLEAFVTRLDRQQAHIEVSLTDQTRQESRPACEHSSHHPLPSKVGNLAMLLAMRRASSSVSTLAMWHQFGFSRE